MAYIGKSPSVGAYKVCDAITTSATDTFNLLVGGVATSPETANNCIVSLNGVVQKPGASGGFTISGSTIVFASALTTADVIDFIYILGDVMSIGTPSDSTVSLAKLTATGSASSSTFLRGDNAWASAGGGKINKVVSTNKTDEWSESVAADGASANITGLTVTIQPSASDSKVLVIVSGNFDASTDAVFGYLLRDDVDLTVADASSTRRRAAFGQDSATGNANNHMGITYLDSPGGTSPYVYSVRVGHVSTATQTCYCNRSAADTDDPSKGRTTSQITVMEILA